jgi:hypothetical protein
MLNNSKINSTFAELSQQFCTAEESSKPHGCSTPPMGLSFCTLCEGEGNIEIIACGMPASECCGGCTTTKECQDCNGTGLCHQEKEN